MKTNVSKIKSMLDSRATLWVLVALYTFLLPEIFIIYRAFLNSFGKDVVGKVPLVIVNILGIAYIVAVLLIRKNPKYLLYLIPCGIISFLIMSLQDNPNKHIHIPEYVLMAWLLFAVLGRDYRGKGLFILIFIYASLLGIVDELEQGIHPSRFYGWSDMLVNSSSSLIGIFTILGLKNITKGDWAWKKDLNRFKSLIWLNVCGLFGTSIMCVYLFRVQAGEKFWGIYPIWLWIWNLVFIIIAPVLIRNHQLKQQKFLQTAKGGDLSKVSNDYKTARLWVYPLLAILYYINALLIFVSVTGVEFS